MAVFFSSLEELRFGFHPWKCPTLEVIRVQLKIILEETKFTTNSSLNVTKTKGNYLKRFLRFLRILVSRNNGVPPAPPALSILYTSYDSVSLGWTPTLDGGSPLISYQIHYHKEFGDWDKIEVQPDVNEHVLNNLKCGTNYQFYIRVCSFEIRLNFLIT